MRRTLLISNAVVVGIDLGTSNSAVAAVTDGTARVLADARGGSVPSIVSITQVGACCSCLPCTLLLLPRSSAAACIQTCPSLLCVQTGATVVCEEAPGAVERYHSFKRLIGRK